MKKLLTGFTIGVMVMILAACSGGGGEFLGKWQNTKNKVLMLEITKEGSGFIVEETRPNFLTGAVVKERSLGAAKDGILRFEEIGLAHLEYVKASDSLLVRGATYTRIKPGASETK